MISLIGLLDINGLLPLINEYKDFLCVIVLFFFESFGISKFLLLLEFCLDIELFDNGKSSLYKCKRKKI